MEKESQSVKDLIEEKIQMEMGKLGEADPGDTLHNLLLEMERKPKGDIMIVSLEVWKSLKAAERMGETSFWRKVRALARMMSKCDFNKSRGSCGVAPFKLKKSYFLNSACKWHDKAYADVDWSQGSAATDWEFYLKGLDLAKHDGERDEALVSYSIARLWGKMRFGLNKIGIKW